MNEIYSADLAELLQKGGVAVLPTDTIYGIVGSALNHKTVERIYSTRERNEKKPCIILIGDKEDLKQFSINLSPAQEEKMEEFWPGPVSVILNCSNNRFAYLHRGTNTLAFRLPAQENLREFLKTTGPLIAPSANPEGEPPAKNINEAKKYFGNQVDYYADGNEIVGRASKVIKLNSDGGITIIRP